jgi:hypothetical protein
MSYDLYLMPRPPAGTDPMDALEALEDEDERPPTPEEAQRNAKIEAALKEALPQLEDNRGDAALDGSVALMDPKGLEVDIDAQSGFINFPYWDSLDADQLQRDIDLVARIVREHTGWELYDPQQDAWTGPDDEGFEEAFDQGRQVIRDMAREDSQPKREPWWRRLTGKR